MVCGWSGLELLLATLKYELLIGQTGPYSSVVGGCLTITYTHTHTNILTCHWFNLICMYTL